jgi:hypothetical protein
MKLSPKKRRLLDVAKAQRGRLRRSVADDQLRTYFKVVRWVVQNRV